MPTLNWIGKEAVENHHNEVPFRLLKRNNKLSVGEADSGNLLVQGDNLEALKALLPYYAGQVKCIYIDPPYNTGNENWVYNDNVNSPEMKDWLGRVVGKEGEDLSRSDKWLCMMYPRLSLLKQFLKEDGVIFISIDDTELQNLLFIGDEIFKHRIAIFTWVRKKKGSNLSKEFRKITEYIVVYKNTNRKIELFGVPAYAEKQVPLLNRANNISEISFPANKVFAGSGLKDGILKTGAFGKGELVVNLKNDITIENSVILTPFAIEGRFRWSQTTAEEELENGSIFTISKTFRINVARHNQSEKFKAPSSLLTPNDGVGTNEDATEELRKIFPELDKLPFDFPKPVVLIQHLIRSITNNEKDAIILDSFAGSGTTGHSVLELNWQEDNGNRKFILVELDKNICDTVTYERLKRIGTVYKHSFNYVEMDKSLFDAEGQIRDEVSFNDLARHIYFCETGEPLPKTTRDNSPLLGIHKKVGIYLLYNGILKDKTVNGGNVLTSKVLTYLPKFDGKKVIYGTACRLSDKKLRSEQIIFRQTPYEIRIS